LPISGILRINSKRVSNFTSRLIGWRSIPDMHTPNRFESFQKWEDARRFELGFPSYPTIYALNYTTKLLLDIGTNKIENHVLALGGYLIKQLQQLNYQVMTPISSEERAGNISVISKDGKKIASLLRQENIYIWGGDGRIR